MEKISANKRHAIEREAPGPGREQRGRERQQHRDADDGRLAPPQGKEHQRDHRSGREDQLLDQLERLVVGGRPVVAADLDAYAFRNDAVLQFGDARTQARGDIDRVLAGLLGDAERDGRIFAVPARCPTGVPYQT